MGLIPSKARIKEAVFRGTARSGNLAYTAASTLRRSAVTKLAARRPESFVRTPEAIEAETSHRMAPTLQHVVKEITGRTLPLDQVRQIIRRGAHTGLFNNYGEAIFINPHHAEDLLEKLTIPLEQKSDFLAAARKHYLLREYVFADQSKGFFGAAFRELDRGTYMERGYFVYTRDGKPLTVTRIINQDRVKTNDDNPSLLLIPGIACHSGMFDLDAETSLALELADKGNWTFLFDPRGLGKNKGEFDAQCFFDTLVSNDLPAAVEFLYNRPKTKKPVVLVGYSIGGMIAEFMLVRQAYKLNSLVRDICKLSGKRSDFEPKGKTRREVATFLNETTAALTNGKQPDQEIKIIIAEARTFLAMLDCVKGLITIGSPKIFDKNSHPIFPALLMLNIFLPIFGAESVPVDVAKGLVKVLPSLTIVARQLINPDNFDDPKQFLASFTNKGTGSFPLGVGLQLLKAVYSGKGIRRMGNGRFNYSAHLDEIPPDIPIFHLTGSLDPLAPPFNLAFIQPDYYQGKALDFSQFPGYQHREKGIHNFSRQRDLHYLRLSKVASQVHGFAIAGLSHLDLLYGKTAEAIVRPLLHQLIDVIWQA